MKPVVFLCLLFLSVGCEQNKPSFDKQQISKEVEQMLLDYHQEIGEKGLLAEFDYLDQSDDFFWVPPGYHSALSFDSVKVILEGNAPALSAVSLRWDTLRIIPLSNQLANYTGIVRMETTDTSGVVSAGRLIESGTIIKRDEGWNLLSGQSAVLIDVK